MEPSIYAMNEISDFEIMFTLQGVDTSVANGIRRTILSNINTVVFRTSPYEKNDSVFILNTSRFNNEILKQRLSCIPIHIKDFDKIRDLEIHVNAENTSKDIQWVTTEHFEIYDTVKEDYLNKKERDLIFPRNKITGNYIDFVRLRPKISDEIPGEQIKFIAKMTISNAKENTMFNVACNSSYGFTLDQSKADKAWEIRKNDLEIDGLNNEQIEFAKKDWDLLEAKRHYKSNSFDFNIESVGVFTSKELIIKACEVLEEEFESFKSVIDVEYNDIVTLSPVNLSNSYDIKLNGKDNTFGKLIEYSIYSLYHEKELISYIGFKIFHPHDGFGVLRLAFQNDPDETIIKDLIKRSCNNIKIIIGKVKKLFQ